MNKKYQFAPTQKWILFGGSYSGALALWLVELYPNVAYGAISSSGTVEARMDFSEYFANVSQTFISNSNSCANAIKTGFQDLQTMMNTSTDGIELQQILS